MCVLAGLAAMAAFASAARVPFDAQIMIDRALNSPTLTIRYSGANASVVELRINGESIGTRSVTPSKSAGETNFTIDLAQLRDGDNEVEIRLYDKAGKMVGSDKTNISTDQSDQGPVFLKTPKVGATLQGPVEIDLGFGRDLKNVYVSYFVDSDFKKMTNFPPYGFVWDTTLESNGWHELEAWVIDETSTTYKTRKTRVFVNNPGGRTDRPGVKAPSTIKSTGVKPTVEGEQTVMKPLTAPGVASGSSIDGSAPNPKAELKASSIKLTVGTMSGAKPVAKSTDLIATGTKSIAPTMIVAKNTVSSGVSTSTMTAVKTAAGMVSITKGARLPNVKTFAVIYNSEYVNFDVNPRVDDGVPMTPFRHLLEKAGGKVDWENLSKSIKATSDGKNIFLQIGDERAKVDEVVVSMEKAPYLENGRTIVPLSFLQDVLKVNIEYDKETGHVLITSLK